MSETRDRQILVRKLKKPITRHFSYFITSVSFSNIYNRKTRREI